jgi:hypothetical protein
VVVAMQSRFISVALLALLAACSKAPQGEAEKTTQALAAPAAPAPPPAPAASGRKVEVKSDLFEFTYNYPAAAANIPALKSWLEADLAKGRKGLEDSAKEGREEAKSSGFDYQPYANGTDWKVVADLPQWLSLSAMVYDYSGGAHPNHGYAALLWDKAAGKRIAASDLFISKVALSAALRGSFCDLLDKERSKRRGEKVNRASGDDFDKCIDPVESTVILGSSDKQHFDRIGVLVGPYEAGPYAEGDYEITLPVTAKLLAAVKPAYRGAFAAGR